MQSHLVDENGIPLLSPLWFVSKMFMGGVEGSAGICDEDYKLIGGSLLGRIYTQSIVHWRRPTVIICRSVQLTMPPYNYKLPHRPFSRNVL